MQTTARRKNERAGAAAPGAWWVVLGVTLAGSVASLNLYKVPPLIPVLARELGITPSEAGALMAIYPLAGMIVAAPGAWLIARTSPRLTIVLGNLLILLGSAAGALSSGLWQLLATRFVEGLGLALISIAAIVLLAGWFPPARRGLPVGVFSIWMPVGSLLMLTIAPAVEAVGGWRAVWWLGCAATLAALAVGELSIRTAAAPPPAPASGPRPLLNTWRRAWDVLGSPAAALALAFALFHATRQGFLTWAPTFLVGRGLPLAEAAVLTSLVSVLSIPLSIVSGGIIRSVGAARWMAVAGLLFNAPLLVAVFFLPIIWVAPVVLLSGAVSAVVPTAVNLSAPEARRPGDSAGRAVATVAVGRNLGMLSGPFLAGLWLQYTAFNWWGIAVGFGAASLVGAAVSWLARPRTASGSGRTP